ncbi:MAG: hypothetical protein JWQ14_1938 [Adhaeribacter sp.]|nr:hypothetical protein [Adhaeribacter sp.]
MIFTVHHTCSNEGGRDHVLENVPFLSEYKPKEKKKPYLGEGYYFWEYNLDYAKVWGKINYFNQYYVCEGDVNIDHTEEGYFLDLVGSRKDLVGFVSLLSEFNLIHEEGTKGIDLCYIINYLRKNFDEEVFPFKVIRAVDYHNNDLHGVKISFNEDRPSYTILNPRIIFSFKNKSDIRYVREPFITFAS